MVGERMDALDQIAISDAIWRLAPRASFRSLRLEDGSVVVHRSMRPLKFLDHRLAYPHRLERLDYRIVGDAPHIGFVHGIHGDEDSDNSYWDQSLQISGIDHVYIPDANPLALMINNRGMIFPREKDNQTEVILTDLNRQFGIPNHAKSWEEIFYKLSDNQAQLLLSMLREQPQVGNWFCLHEDTQYGHNDDGHGGYDQQLGERDGFYFYDTPFDARSDNDFGLIARLLGDLRKILRAEGFHLACGNVDPSDPMVGLPAVDGYIYEPVIREDGSCPEDTTFEGVAMRLGGLGFTKTERVFSFEIPGGLTLERRKLMIGCVMNTFILPFISEKKY